MLYVGHTLSVNRQVRCLREWGCFREVWFYSWALILQNTLGIRSQLPLSHTCFCLSDGAYVYDLLSCLIVNMHVSHQVHVGTLYTVRLTHGHFHWTVKRKYKHFQELHRDLYKHRMMLQLLPLARSVYQSVCANKALHLRVAQSNPCGRFHLSFSAGRIP